MLKKLIVTCIRVLPMARRYLDEKMDMSHRLAVQQDKLATVRRQNDQYRREIRSLKGEIPNSISVHLPVKEEDIAQALSPMGHVEKLPKFSGESLLINWVVPPMGSVSGGHTDIFRTIGYLEEHGHTCRVYIYDPMHHQTIDNIRLLLKNNYPEIKSEIFYNEGEIKDCDAIFATSWETAYPVYNFKGVGRKYYYVQDFEPYFHPLSTHYLLAGKTYSFHLRGITLGEWLSNKLQKEYDMSCSYFDFGVNNEEYFLINPSPRNDIFCYARPFTPRRGFELSILALKKFNLKYPEKRIHLVGWDVSQYRIPFPYIDHGVLSHEELNKLYNKCVAGLIISLTNMSLIPLEAMAAGAVPVVNDGENTKAVKYSKWVCYAEPSPEGLASALEKAILDKNLASRVKEASNFAAEYDWRKSNSKIEKILLRDAKTKE